MQQQTTVGENRSVLDTLCINTIRTLSIDAVQKANSGHPGLPLGAAPMGYVLWTKFLKHNPADPKWFDRDRFVLSAGHGSMLLYSLLYLTGYDLSLEQIKQFRQWDGITPGHPEIHVTPGVEVTTGPLGQGFANGVGMAIAEAHLAARFNRPGHEIISHYTYAIAGDGDLMEGVSAEAASLAGTLRLGKLIYFYDSNRISLAGSTDMIFDEDVAARFRAYGWHIVLVADGNDVVALSRAIEEARAETVRPSLIVVRTHIGYGSPNKQDTFEAHGSPLGPDEVRLTKEQLGWPVEPAFYVPDEALSHFREAVERGKDWQNEWNARFEAYAGRFPDLANELRMMMAGELPQGWADHLPAFPADKPLATRVAGGKAMNALAPYVPGLIGGSADLDPSTMTALEGMGDFANPSADWSKTQGGAGGGFGYAGRNIHFGVREHAMGAIVNGIAAHGGLIPYGATFLVFSDYMRPTIRLAALMNVHSIFIFTHDSIGVGEDGPTHEPVEQVLALRAIPTLTVIRPADANETVAAWRIALERKEGPVALILSRQKLPILDPARYPGMAEGVGRGAYVLTDSEGGAPQLVLVATGSEVSLVLEAAEKLAVEGHRVRVVSMPSTNLFDLQDDSYHWQLFPAGVPVLSVEAGVTLGWRSYLESRAGTIGVDRFGASAPGELVMREYGFTVEAVVAAARRLLDNKRA